MPWKECNQMDERLRLVAKLLDGEKMAAVCREFGISRKTGYKIFNRYKDIGIEGLQDRSRTPYRYANRLPFQVEKLFLVSSRSIQPGVHQKSGINRQSVSDDPSPGEKHHSHYLSA
jgi:transposase-like protein